MSRGVVVYSLSVDFVRYVALLKTIRGILITTSKPKDKVFGWLRRSIRWRPIGASRNIILLLKRYGFGSKLIKEVVYPFQEFGEISSILADGGLDRNIADAIVLSSAYIVPLVILDIKTLDHLRRANIVAYEIRTQKKLKDKDIKLHMRIAEYSVKDYYFDVIAKTAEAIASGEIEAILKKRAKTCTKDSKRYWRIKQDRGRTIIIYIDHLRLLRDKTERLKDILHRDKKIMMTLGIPVGLIIEEMLSD